MWFQPNSDSMVTDVVFYEHAASQFCVCALRFILSWQSPSAQ